MTCRSSSSLSLARESERERERKRDGSDRRIPRVVSFALALAANLLLLPIFFLDITVNGIYDRALGSDFYCAGFSSSVQPWCPSHLPHSSPVHPLIQQQPQLMLQVQEGTGGSGGVHGAIGGYGYESVEDHTETLPCRAPSASSATMSRASSSSRSTKHFPLLHVAFWLFGTSLLCPVGSTVKVLAAAPIPASPTLDNGNGNKGDNAPVASPSVSNADAESYASYFRRRANAIWEAATGPIPATAPPETSRPSTRDEAAATATTPSTTEKLTGARLGYQLLQNGDAAGAELACLQATKAQTGSSNNNGNINGDEDAVEAWTCLGEARLALYQAAYSKAAKSASVGGGITYEMKMLRAMNKLSAARDSFERAVMADPTHASSRAGMGLCMLLMATRSSGLEGGRETKEMKHVDQFISRYALSDNANDGDEQGRQEVVTMADSILATSTAQLLFDATQHLQAATDMTMSRSSQEPLHVATVHNLALAHLALGDASTAVPLLRRAAHSIAEQAATGTSAPGAAKVLTSEEVNLGSALLEIGMVEEAVATLSDIAERHCNNEVPDGTGSIMDDERKKSLCSIVFNNLGVSYEMIEESSVASANYDLSIHMNSSSVGGLNMLALSVAENDSGVPELVVENGSERTAANAISIAKEDEEKSDIGAVDSQWRAAIEALRTAVSLNPDNSRAWVSLSKALSHE